MVDNERISERVQRMRLEALASPGADPHDLARAQLRREDVRFPGMPAFTAEDEAAWRARPGEELLALAWVGERGGPRRLQVIRVARDAAFKILGRATSILPYIQLTDA